jgi:uncharacterized protein YkwD
MTVRPRGRRPIVALSAVLLAVISLSTTPTAVLASVATDAESLLVDLINEDRADAGLVPLRRLHPLAVVAGDRAAAMASANVSNHTVGGDLGDQLDDEGVVWYGYGETVGYSFAGWASGAARQLHDLWMGSPAHRDLLMSPDFNYVGAGLAYRSSNDRTFGTIVLTETADRSGARSWFATTTASISGRDITWRWSGADLLLQTHTAGLRDFDVQYRVGSGPWVTTRNDSTATSITLRGRTPGVTYGMRVRATDRRGNIGAWTAESRVTLP